MTVQLARSAGQIAACFDVLHALRPHLDAENFVPLVQEMMQEGYQLAYVEEDGKAVAAIGFRYLQFLFNGKHFYIDDLSTLPQARKKGYGGLLLDYVADLAKQQGCTNITLDSGHQRFDAHRLYLNKGFRIIAHHFLKEL